MCPRWVVGIEKAVWILVVALFSGGGCASVPVFGAQYWRIETPSLEILSTLSEEETRRITEDLLLFRDVVHSITTLKTDYARVPTTLIVLDNKTWKDLEPPKGELGFFAPGLGLREDPVTGSAHALVAPWWCEQLRQSSVRGWQPSHRPGGLCCEPLSSGMIRLTGDGVILWDGDLRSEPAHPSAEPWLALHPN